MICGGKIPGCDSVYRHAIYPIIFRSKQFASDKFVKLDFRNEMLLSSFAWERYVPTAELVHGYGCRLALGINEEKIRKYGRLKPRDRHVYCGAYSIKAHALRSLPSVEGLDEVLSVDVTQLVENGEISHTELKVVLTPAGLANVEGTKTVIVDRLWRLSQGPVKHICDCDKDLDPHPNSDLGSSPNGEYSDTKSPSVRFWWITRFKICRCRFLIGVMIAELITKISRSCRSSQTQKPTDAA